MLTRPAALLGPLVPFLAACWPATHAPAQEPAAPRPTEAPAARATAPVVFEVAGAATLRRTFLPTNLGSMLAAKEGEALWRPLVEQIDRVARAMQGGDEAQYAAARERLLGYDGRLRVLAFPGEKSWALLVATADGRTDLGALGADVERLLLGVAKGEPVRRTAGGRELTLLALPAGNTITLPVRAGEDLVCLLGEGEPGLEARLEQGLRALAATPAAAAPVWLQVDLAALADPEDAGGFLTSFVAGRLGTLSVALGTSGPHVRADLALGFTGDDRGLFEFLLPDVQGVPELLGRLPADATPWSAFHLGFDRLWPAFAAAMVADGEDIAEVEKQMKDAIGIHIHRDFLAHVGTEVLVIGDLWGGEDGRRMAEGEDPALGACMVFALRDEQAFGKGFDSLIAASGGVIRKGGRREHRGVAITELVGFWPVGVEYAIAKDCLLLAFGADGIAALERFLAKEPGEPPAAVARAERLAPAGWNGLAVADLAALFGGQVTLLLELVEDSLPHGTLGFDSGPAHELLRSAVPLLEEHGLTELRAMSGYSDRQFRVRLVW